MNRVGGEAQGVEQAGGPDLKSQYCQKNNQQTRLLQTALNRNEGE
jgi:hypothetical protein